ncbi:hypothetical protein EV401DRAFT_379340 [Pisolithus croceorrhizus]|nr:hypothetical protein EV401DRAFT_379340 [Pisolithus croceorrhizus]
MYILSDAWFCSALVLSSVQKLVHLLLPPSRGHEVGVGRPDSQLLANTSCPTTWQPHHRVTRHATPRQLGFPSPGRRDSTAHDENTALENVVMYAL